MAYNVKKILERKKIIYVIIMCDIIHVSFAINIILARVCVCVCVCVCVVCVVCVCVCVVCVCVCVNHVTKEEENQILTSSTYNK